MHKENELSAEVHNDECKSSRYMKFQSTHSIVYLGPTQIL